MRPQGRQGRAAPRQRPSSIQSSRLELGRRHQPDYWLLIWCAALLAIGLIVVYSISPALGAAHNVSGDYFVTKQLIAIGLGLAALAITASIPLEWWRRAYKPLLVVAGIATLLALVLPVDPNYPAHRWVRLGSFSFQSVELLKFAVLLWLAGLLAYKMRNGTPTIDHQQRGMGPLLIALALVGFVVVFVQSDLGSAGVMVAMMGTMAFVAGIPMGRILMIIGIILVGLILAVAATPYRRERLQSFMNPEAHCETSGYQACQSLISIGSGGIVGLGLGSSVQAYGYQPEAANDSIFAIYAEKFGYIGSLVILAIYAAFFARIKRTGERLQDNFSRLLVVGVLAWFSVQMLINIGGMVGLLPLKGITLPFVSYGGTSVVFAAAAVGLVFQASRYTSMGPIRVARDQSTASPVERNSMVRERQARLGRANY